MPYNSLLTTPTPAHNRHAGLALIEVLVTIVVMSFGLLAIAITQLSAKRSAFEASQRTYAIYLAQDLIDRIRTNTPATTSYTTASPIGGSLTGSRPTCAAASCTPQERAAQDMWDWVSALRGAGVTVAGNAKTTLVEPRACVAFTPDSILTQTGVLRVTLFWLPLGIDPNEAPPDPNDLSCAERDPADPRWQRLSLDTYVFNIEDLNR
ncbi:type IV pilus modification protein PilV [Tepidimonas thermarum]|uniref:Type IV pilus modification protein PilV n=1 Tax=Tepidimonas thermarum TaxID=335431 RepID=A0A554WYY2_9BURK|nr:type IV pilus modification protein PilV [Tepidimonas thermarum]TSE28790.1 type IV pilus modification protein PilV [Tepidimonas thermarum]